MGKFVLAFTFIISLVSSNMVNATLITDSSLLTSDHYVTYEGGGVIIDFAWASPVNVEYWGDPDLNTTNRLYAPELHEGWGYASDSDIDILFANFTIDDFSNGDGSYIQAVSFWNSVFDDIVLTLNGVVFDGNLLDYTPGKVSSEWASSGVDGSQVLGSGNETFYVRTTIINNPAPIPEPSTLMIFALALIALASKKRLFS
ncbi:hypothetical protein A9Q74_15440 [Colwellia sp. 39_35_sub15_T18]|nr:hypothetical protein A9Q74_15440 [Colwellia sp. 39_35_sub15_T18]